MLEQITHSPQTQTYSFSLRLQMLNSLWQKSKRHVQSLWSPAVLGTPAK